MSTTSSPDLLLDTHVWLWYSRGDRARLSTGVFGLLEQSGVSRGLVVSVVSLRELGILEVRGRLRFEIAFTAWVSEAIRRTRVRVASLEPDVSVLSTRLPGLVHRDPWDQLLIATALYYDWMLVTRDRAILDYARAGHVRAVDAGSGRLVREAARRPYRRKRGR